MEHTHLSKNLNTAQWVKQRISALRSHTFACNTHRSIQRLWEPHVQLAEFIQELTCVSHTIVWFLVDLCIWLEDYSLPCVPRMTTLASIVGVRSEPLRIRLDEPRNDMISEDATAHQISSRPRITQLQIKRHTDCTGSPILDNYTTAASLSPFYTHTYTRTDPPLARLHLFKQAWLSAWAIASASVGMVWLLCAP